MKLTKQLLKLVNIALEELQEVNLAVQDVSSNFLNSFIKTVLIKYRCYQIRQKMKQVKSYKEYERFAKMLDHLERHNDWKHQKQSRQYDYERIESRLLMMKHLRKQNQVKTLVHCLRQDLVKDIGRISNPELYNQAHFGTKRLIEKYHNEVIKCIKLIYQCSPSKMSIRQKLTFFSETRHSYGHTALLLSGGASFGKFHFGLIKALLEQDLLPRIVCGSSIGSMMAGIMCTRPYNRMEKDGFFDPAVITKLPMVGRKFESILEAVQLFFKNKPLLCTETLARYAYDFMGDHTFRDTHEKYGWTLNISVTSANSLEPVLLNYLTAPNVIVWSAVVASCSIPGVFAPTDLLMRTYDGKQIPYNPSSTGQRYSDGSVAGDLPMKRLSQLFNVNTFFVSQVNPHVVKFMGVESDEVLDFIISKKIVNKMKVVAENHMYYMFKQLNSLGLLSNNLHWIVSLINQTNKGHVTIRPSPGFNDYANLLNDLTTETFWPAFQSSYTKTLRKMAHIRSYFGIEREFDRYYKLLKSQLRESSQIDQAELPDLDLIQIGATKTFDRSKAWENPNPEIPLTIAHNFQNPEALTIEHLCIQQNEFVIDDLNKPEDTKSNDEAWNFTTGAETNQLNIGMMERILKDPSKKFYRNPMSLEMPGGSNNHLIPGTTQPHQNSSAKKKKYASSACSFGDEFDDKDIDRLSLNLQETDPSNVNCLMFMGNNGQFISQENGSLNVENQQCAFTLKDVNDYARLVEGQNDPFLGNDRKDSMDTVLGQEFKLFNRQDSAIEPYSVGQT